MNDSILKLLERLRCDVATPDPDKLFCEDVRYLDQLDEFSRKGVDCVIYLQSFGCMKAHVHARGFAHEYARRYPDMPITVIDYDPESSALNRENRIRLAVEAAMRAKSERSGPKKNRAQQIPAFHEQPANAHATHAGSVRWEDGALGAALATARFHRPLMRKTS